MGKNTISAVPKEMARSLNKPNIDGYTFHSLRRSSATAAADNGATAAQLQDFYGWSHPNMPQEYISSSKISIQKMATRLQGDSNGEMLETSKMSTGSAANIGQVHSDKMIYIENFSGTLQI